MAVVVAEEEVEVEDEAEVEAEAERVTTEGSYSMAEAAG